MTAPSWERMLAKAFVIIDEVNRTGNILDGVTLGGGTALMLQIGHRDSRDIDLFLPDPQLLGFVAAAVADMEAWMPDASYRGDGSLHVKVSFEGEGEVDFIAAPPVTDHEPLKGTFMGRELLLDSVPAIIASKVHYRSSLLKARDIFDIAAACEAGHRKAIREALATMPEQSAVALKRIGMLHTGQLSELMPRNEIHHGFEHLLEDAPAIAREVLTFHPQPEPPSRRYRDEGSSSCDPLDDPYSIPDPFEPPSPWDG